MGRLLELTASICKFITEFSNTLRHGTQKEGKKATFKEILQPVRLRGTLGSGPVEAVTGAYDIGMSRTADVGLGRGSQMLALTGTDQISLADIMNAPSLSFDQITQNARSNAVPMALAAVTFNVGASVFKKIMRKPFTQANKLIKPLGLNVRIG